MIYDKKKLINSIEFVLIFVFFVLPPIFVRKKMADIFVYKGAINNFLFVFKVIFLAFYEEFIYRMYLPFRIKSFYAIEHKPSKTVFFAAEIVPAVLFAAAHSYLGFYNTLYALAAGFIFRFIYCFFKNKINAAAALGILSILHSGHNIFWLYFLSKP